MIEVMVSGIVAVYFAGRLVALLDDQGRLVWKEIFFPISTIEFIINRPTHDTYIWN